MTDSKEEPVSFFFSVISFVLLLITLRPVTSFIEKNFFYFCVPHHFNLWVFESALLHWFTCTELVFSVNQVNFLCKTSQEVCSFKSSVTTTYNVNNSVAVEKSIASSTYKTPLPISSISFLSAQVFCWSTSWNDQSVMNSALSHFTWNGLLKDRHLLLCWKVFSSKT